MWTKLEHKTIESLEALYRKKKIGGTEIMLLLTLSRFSWGTGKNRNPCTKKLRQIAEMLGKSESSLRRNMRCLQRAGIINQLYRTCKESEDIKTTFLEDRAHQRVKAGAKQLWSFFQLKWDGISTNVKVRK